MGEQVSFFASEYEQIQTIDEAESAQKAPSAFSMPQDIIDDFLRSGGNMERLFEALNAAFVAAAGA